MLPRLKAIYQSGKDYVIDFVSQTQSTVAASFTSELVCITIRLKEFSLMHARINGGKILVDSLETYPYDNLQAELSVALRKSDFKLTPCIWVLQPEEYQLILTDSLPVVESEFQSAARWKLKDFIRFPKEDAVFDHFAMPKSPVDPVNKIMVVATRLSYLQSKVELMTECGLDVNYIDIPELSYRNFTANYEEDGSSTILINLQEKQTQLIITCQKQIFFNRLLNFGLEMNKKNPDLDEHQKNIDRLGLEIQRSSEYFQSQWRMPFPTRHFIIPTTIISGDEAIYLSQRLNADIKMINVSEVLEIKKELDLAQQQKYFTLFGEAFRIVRA